MNKCINCKTNEVQQGTSLCKICLGVAVGQSASMLGKLGGLATKMPRKDQLINYMIDCMGYSLDDVDPNINTVYDLYKQLTPKQVMECYHYAGELAPGEIE